MHRLLCFKSRFPNHFALNTWTLLVLVVFGVVQLTWMVKTCTPWKTNQLIQLLVIN